MAAAFLRYHSAGAITVLSAGSAPANTINPVVIEVMAERGLGLETEQPTLLDNEAVQAADVCITMGCGDVCTVYPGTTYLDWELDDPSDRDIVAVRKIRDAIENFVLTLLDDMTETTSRHPIYDLSDKMLDDLTRLFPTNATFAGVKGNDHLWDDLSPSGVAATSKVLGQWLDRVNALPPGNGQWDELAILVARDALTVPIQDIADGRHLRDLNSVASSFQSFREIFDHMPKDSVQGWQNIESRLSSLASAISGYQESLDIGRTNGMAVAIRQVESVIKQARVSASDESPILHVAREARDSEYVDAALLSHIEAGTKIAIIAFGGFADWLDSVYLPDATAEDAVGSERYLSETRRYLGETIDLAETYDWGWREVDFLRGRMQALAHEITPGGGIDNALTALKTERQWGIAPDHATFVAAMQDRLDVALRRLDKTYFDVPKSIRSVDVKIAAPGGALGAYYVGPSEDFTRAGCVWWSFAGESKVPMWDEVTTAYHEGFPGHHLQVGMQASFTQRLSRIHRLWTWLPGMGEGWALYAETLMDELGYFDTAGIEFGYLASQMLRAARVVIDIGIHLKLEIPSNQPLHGREDWSYEIAVQYLEEYVGLSHEYAESEVTRYSGWPGQAISYKVGERAILDMRRQLSDEAGGNFDLKSFHQQLLEIGPVGIDTVRTLMLDNDKQQ